MKFAAKSLPGLMAVVGVLSMASNTEATQIMVVDLDYVGVWADYDVSTGGDDTGGLTASASITGVNYGPESASYWWHGVASYFNTAQTATWTVSGYTPGTTVHVYAHWRDSGTQGNADSAASYVVNGGTPVIKNQQQVPDADLTLNDGAQDHRFEILGSYTADGAGQVQVVLSHGNNYTAVDAVAFETVPTTVTQIPPIINYQGRVSVGGTNFTGAGQFKFSLVNGGASQTYWSSGSDPVPLTVAQGLYSVLLGDTNVANMAPLPTSVFTNNDVWLRIWFNDGLSGLKQLNPDQRLAAIGYAMMAAHVPDGLITSNKLTPGAVTTGALAAGSVGSGQLAAGAVTALNIASNAVTSAQVAAGAITGAIIASNAVTAANFAPDTGFVPTGTLVLSATANNPALLAAGYTPQGKTLGVDWNRATHTAPWPARRNFGTLSHDNLLWVLGGSSSPGVFLHDVWSSSDGVSWSQVTDAAPWSGRSAFGAVTFNSQIWVLGGYTNGTARLHDVWSSSDGTAWTQATNAAAWTGRNAFGAVALNGQMWVLGGSSDGVNNLNDVWSSSNGVTWTQATSTAPWSARYGHAAVAFDGRMWVLGGSSGGMYVNDVWSSSNGVAWTQETSAAPWSGRAYFAAVALSDQIWVLGGYGAAGYSNDVWSSSDGVAWTQVTAAAPWGTRYGLGAVAHDDQMWVLGGSDSGYLNDVWYSQPTVTNMLGSYYLYLKQ